MEQIQESLLTIKELKNAVHGKIVGLAENIKNFSFTSGVHSLPPLKSHVSVLKQL